MGDFLFKLIGLDYTQEGSKAPEFSSNFNMLGVQIDTSHIDEAYVLVGHTAERLEAFDRAFTERRLFAKIAESLRGRMVFYECFAAGRLRISF